MIPSLARYRAAGDGDSAYTALLLHFDEAGTVVDSGKYGLIPTVSGGAQNTSISKFGGSSRDSWGYVSFSDARLVAGSQPVTVSAWVYPTGFGSQNFIFDSRNGGGTASGFLMYLNSSGHLAASFGGGDIFSTDPLTVHTLNHVELGYDGTTLYMFLNGVLENTLTFSTTMSSPTWVIGAAQFFPVGVDAFAGCIDEYRVLIGKCDHTASFTPPATAYS